MEKKLKTKAQVKGFAQAMLASTYTLGNPRQASHKLNKRQFKAGCGYKERSIAKREFGYGKDKNTPLIPFDIRPSYYGKTFKPYSKQ